MRDQDPDDPAHSRVVSIVFQRRHVTGAEWPQHHPSQQVRPPEQARPQRKTSGDPSTSCNLVSRLVCISV